MRTPRLPLALACAALIAGACGKNDAARQPETPLEPATYMGPEITLDTPSRGAMLAQGGEGPEPVAIGGHACDKVHPLTALAVLGGPPLDIAGESACHPFNVEVESRWGLTVVTGSVVNAAGEKGALAQSFLRSPGYFDLTGDGPDSFAASGILLQVGPSFFDDGDRSTPGDVATAIQSALAGQDLDAAVGALQLAQPDANGDGAIDTASYACVLFTKENKRTGFEARKSGALTTAGITVDRLALEDGGLSVSVTVHGAAVPFSVTGNLDSGCLGAAQMTAEGNVTADAITIVGSAQAGVDATGQPGVTLTSVATTVSGLNVGLDLGALVAFTGLGSVIGDALAAAVRGPIQEAISGAVKGTLGAGLSRSIPGLAAYQGTIALPAELGGGLLAVDASIDRLDFTAQRGVIGAAFRIRATQPKPEHAAAPFGAMRMGGLLPDLSALAGDPISLGVEDDVLNQFLHAAWLSGAFDLDDVGQLVDLGNPPAAHLSFFSNLPPALMPRSPGSSEVDIGWGDVAFDLELTGSRGAARTKGFLSVIVGLEGFQTDASARTLTPVFGSDPEVHVQISEVNWDHLPTTRALAGEVVQSLVRNALPGILARAVSSFPLPEVNLGAIDPSLSPVALSFRGPGTSRLGRYEFLAGR